MKFAFRVGEINDRIHDYTQWLDDHPEGYKFPSDFDFEGVWNEIIDGYDGSFIWDTEKGEMHSPDYDLALKTIELLGNEKFEYKFGIFNYTHWKAAPTERAFVYIVVDVDAERFFPTVFTAKEITDDLHLELVVRDVNDWVQITLG